METFPAGAVFYIALPANRQLQGTTGGRDAGAAHRVARSGGGGEPRVSGFGFGAGIGSVSEKLLRRNVPVGTKRRKTRPRQGRVISLHASVEDDLLSLADEEMGAEARWNRPRKGRISLRVDIE